uniref:Uncharacterized protein n=1 Tax=Geospiza parvula TaxID=87175 RepID=A0A8C3MEI7_GEOPR
ETSILGYGPGPGKGVMLYCSCLQYSLSFPPFCAPTSECTFYPSDCNLTADGLSLPPLKNSTVNKNFSEHLQKTGIPSGSQDKVSVLDSGPEMAVDPVATSNLSAKAPEFYPSGWHILSLLQDSSFEDRCDGYLTLAEYVQDFLNHLTEQPGCFETEIEQFAETLNGWVIADEALRELVELIYQQATSVPNFSYMGARLCNYLSHHLTISPQSGNFRQLLLQRSVSVNLSLVLFSYIFLVCVLTPSVEIRDTYLKYYRLRSIKTQVHAEY